VADIPGACEDGSEAGHLAGFQEKDRRARYVHRPRNTADSDR
jgi:hypothetical protein